MDLSSRPVPPDPYSLLPQLPPFELTSEDFSDGAELPADLGGDGGNKSPALRWSGFPPQTKSFLVSCFDPDAPTPAGFWHWTVVDIPSSVTALDRGVTNADLPAGAFAVRGDGGEFGYFGPYPPEGDRAHRYYFAVHALDVETLGLDQDASPTKVAFTAIFHSLARAVIVGTYRR